MNTIHRMHQPYGSRNGERPKKKDEINSKVEKKKIMNFSCEQTFLFVHKKFEVQLN